MFAEEEKLRLGLAFEFDRIRRVDEISQRRIAEQTDKSRSTVQRWGSVRAQNVPYLPDLGDFVIFCACNRYDPAETLRTMLRGMNYDSLRKHG